MQGKDFIIGTLKSSGCLKTKSEEILLTKIPTQAAQSPESAILKVAMEDVGKMSMLRVLGYAAGRITNSLEGKGSYLAAEPEGFIVEDSEGPLKKGELERATGWAKGIIESKK